MGQGSSDSTQGTRRLPLIETEWGELARASEVLGEVLSAVDRSCDELTDCTEQSSPVQCLGTFLEIAME